MNSSGRCLTEPKESKRRLSSSSLYLEIAALRAFYKFCETEKLLPVNLAENLSLPAALATHTQILDRRRNRPVARSRPSKQRPRRFAIRRSWSWPMPPVCAFRSSATFAWNNCIWTLGS